MMNDEQDKFLERTLDARAAGARPEPIDDDEVESLVEVADLLWVAAHGAPPLEDDPVAAMLGLVPDPSHSLNAQALKRFRQRARLKVGQLADRLAARGWSVKTADVLRWETRSAADVAPALIKAIAEELGASHESLTHNREASVESERVDSVARSPRFAALADRWAQLQHVPREMAESALKSRMLATVHRGDRPDDEQLLQSLEALLAAVERESESRREP